MLVRTVRNDNLDLDSRLRIYEAAKNHLVQSPFAFQQILW